MLLAAAMARRAGGKRFAQGLAALVVVASHVLLRHGRYFSMNAFDVFFWALAAYIVVRILTGDTPKLWLAVGIVVGLGLLNKYSMGFLCIRLAAGLLFTVQRRHLFTKWFWLGALAALVLFLPHIIWEIKHHFPTLEFMRNASKSNAVAIRQKAVEKFKEKVRHITRRHNGKNLQQTIAELNPLLRGTANYYAKPYTQVRQTLRNWDKWVRHRLRYHKYRRTRLGFKERSRTSNRWFERKGLVAMFELACQRTYGSLRWGTDAGSPGARNTDAGKYRELTLLR